MPALWKTLRALMAQALSLVNMGVGEVDGRSGDSRHESGRNQLEESGKGDQD